MNPTTVRAMQHPVGWKLFADESAEKNRNNVLCRISNVNIVYDQRTLLYDSREKVLAAQCIGKMLDAITQGGLFVTMDGALGVYGKVRGGKIVTVPVANLSIANNLDMLSSVEVNKLFNGKHVPGMTLCMIDMEVFELAVEKRVEPPLLITSIGWWGNDQSRE